MEEQLRAGLAEGQITEFVDHDEVVAQQSLDDPSALSGGLLLFKLIDEIDEIEETAARSGADDGGRDGDRQMGLARACRGRDMAPVFWRVKRRSTTPSILWQGRPWRRRAGA